MTAADFGSVTATVTSGATEATGVPRLGRNETDFLSQVIAWPTQGESGYANLHYSMVNSKPTPAKPLLKGMGWPFRDLGEFVSRAGWVNGTRNFKDVWFCTSLQSTMKKDPKTGKLKAVRLANNALKVKSIWIDMDVGPNDPKKYATIQDALKAVIEFREKVGLPPFSAIVGSGSGIHVYWISETALTPEEWKPYSHGLKTLLLQNGVKCDAGLTIDIARILRVPGTLNHKYDPPRPVQLLNVPLVTYNFGTSLSLLTQIAPQPSAAPGTAKPQHNPFAEEADLKSFKAGPAFRIDGPNLNAGIGKHADIPLNAEPIFAQCGFLGHALKTGGADYNNPLWHLSILASTFMEKGNEMAHAISKGHATYTPVETQALYDRKLAERKARDIGYPSCATIQGDGCSACAACPHLSKGKSPLNLGLPSARAPSPTQNPTAVVKFRDLDQRGLSKPTLANAVIAIRALGIEARLDLFHNRTTVSYSGRSKTIREGLLIDQTVSAVRSLINNTYEIDCGDPNTFAAINEVARDNSFDPVLDLLDDCQGKWDGVKRIDTWVIDYLGCKDTLLNRAIGRSVLIAACRRARVPGCKFDFITVLEGPEGIDKSTAIRVLAGDENFNDQSILGASDKEIQEQLEGTWMHENADLAGMRRADVEQVKAFASRQVDRARPAYGRVREDRPRRSIEWATTNDDTYLLSQTGNRRWWTLKTGRVQIEALKRDREQLLGEAATYEAAGERIGLDESLWDDARNAQEQRRVTDPWEDTLSKLDSNLSVVHRLGDGFERVFSADVLTHVLDIPTAHQTSQHSQRLAKAMKHTGWGRSENGRITIRGVTLRGYIRATPFHVAQQFAHSAMGINDPPPQAVSTGFEINP
jgi:predicted P-loop ATPase